jgi:uncharacterized RDD family membrane protein YckC
VTADRAAASYRAGFVSRLGAGVLDAIVVVVGTALILVVGRMVAAVFAGFAFSFPRPSGIERYGALSVVYVLYLTFFWTTTGRTPGNYLAGLRVSTSDGARLSVPRAFGRALICHFFPVGLLWVLISRRNLAVQDILLGTAVVYDWNARRATTLATGSSGP